MMRVRKVDRKAFADWLSCLVSLTACDVCWVLAVILSVSNYAANAPMAALVQGSLSCCWGHGRNHVVI